MSKDCKRSYEEVHKKLGEELEKAYLKRETPEEKIPEFDLSFLDEQPYEPTEENDAAREEGFYVLKRGEKASLQPVCQGRGSFIIIFLLCNEYHHAGKRFHQIIWRQGILHRLYQGVTGLFTDSKKKRKNRMWKSL